MSLEKLVIRDVRASTMPNGQTLFEVKDTHTLIQAAGYLKHTRGCNNAELIYFRGESKLYPSLPPTAFRSVRQQRGAQNAINSINEGIKRFQRPLAATGSYAHEALLQHYGLKTTWIDLVDNIWVALWFACHTAHAVGQYGEFLHFERRVPRKDPTGKAYVLLVAADAVAPDRYRPGFYRGPRTELLDLRIAAPSVFLRPHAQHGLLMRCRGSTVERPRDYGGQTRGVLEIDLADALEWLGNSTALSTHSLFPPPSYDQGYANLLKVDFSGTAGVGSIHHIGA